MVLQTTTVGGPFFDINKRRVGSTCPPVYDTAIGDPGKTVGGWGIAVILLGALIEAVVVTADNISKRRAENVAREWP